jgi:transposase
MRMLAVANELDGYEREEAARLAGMSDQALRDAIKRLNAEGIDGLYDRPRSGRPRRLTAEHEADVKAAVLGGPDIDKDGLSAFTLEDIRRMIEERHGVRYHLNHVGALADLATPVRIPERVRLDRSPLPATIPVDPHEADNITSM